MFHSDLCKKHLTEEKLKGRNVFSIYFSKASYFLGKTQFAVDSLSCTQNMAALVTTLLLTIWGEKLEIPWGPVSVWGRDRE